MGCCYWENKNEILIETAYIRAYTESGPDACQIDRHAQSDEDIFKNRIDFCDGVKMILQRILTDIKKSGIAFVVVAIFLVSCNFLFGTVCPIAYFFGVPCPGCGMTRAAFALLRGDFCLAAQYNATIYLWALYGVLWLIDRYVIAKKGRLSMVLLIIVCLITLVYYGYRIYTGTMVDVGTQGKINLLFADLCYKM